MTPPDRIVSLIKIREAVAKASSPHTALFISLLDNGKNLSYGSKQQAGRLAFGPGDFDFPGLGKRMSPFGSDMLPPLSELQKILIDDLQKSRQSDIQNDNMNAVWSAETARTQERDEVLELLNSLTDDSRANSGMTVTFPSPSLDSMCTDADIKQDNLLRESMTMATILPADTFLPLQHSNEGSTFTTLMSGSVAWIIWPPSKHNLGILKSSYEAFSEAFDSSKLDVTSQLRGGMCLVQTVGEAIRLPPFCPIMCLALDTSVMATYSVVTANQLADMLGKLPMLLAWFETEIDGERKKKEFVTAFLSHFSAILDGDFETVEPKKWKYPYPEGSPLHSLLRTWDEIKYAVASILDPTEAEKVIVMWEEFLRDVKGRECWICGKRINSKLKDTRKHFEDRHWQTEKVEEDAKKKDSAQPDMAKETALQVQEEAGKRSSPDMMELVEPQDENAMRFGKEDDVVHVPEHKTRADIEDRMDIDEGTKTPLHFS
ncbi:hypothetical protein C7974DRAFT_401351 [Boeremia exigua]|uniref:uncharacterized protein n=1 Tax=Boeremia exigua TaxID=749465 RepID=UPI001E8D9276|nr:uncharacterized protein C7974DRAFT_401351 [Boeremia exigua]KAH6619029.1 hypothetical protein C7974DRAFT_401351 [Boeremia exigua]